MLNSSPPLAPPAPPGRPRFPTRYALQPGYPNPFNPTLTVPYEVPPPGGNVSIRVYNVKGQLVATLVDAPTNPGYRRVAWDGIDRRGNPVSSGVYFVQMLGPRFKQTRKVVLLK